MALAFAREGSGRVALSFIGEGGSSLGEWHEAINLCAARRLPAVFCRREQSDRALDAGARSVGGPRVRRQGVGYGIPGITIDGTDPDEIAAAFAWAVERARAGRGPSLIELVSMRMCGHAHHDDMLYLGKDPQPGWDYPPLHAAGYADPDLYAFWSARDPIPAYAARLELDGVIDAGRARTPEGRVRGHRRAEAAGSHRGAVAGARAGRRRRVRRRSRRASASKSSTRRSGCSSTSSRACRRSMPARRSIASGRTFLEAVMLGVGDALRADPVVFVFGEDVGGTYGNAFLLLRPLLEEFGDRIINSPLAEGAVLGVCVGAALAGQRPIGEMQFNDFVATGFNQLVNNAAKIRYRWGGSVPMVVRMPWGGLRHAGPYHSQNTEAWFYRTPGLKIVVPSTPADARALMASAVADPDPVLFYEHIALYRDPRIKQALADDAPAPLPIGRAALRREGDDLAIISYGAYVHAALRVAEKLAADRHRGQRARSALALPRSTATRCWPARATAAASSSCTRTRAPAASARASPRSSRRRRSSRSTRRFAFSPRSTRRCRTRRRSKQRSCPRTTRSSAPRGYSWRTEASDETASGTGAFIQMPQRVTILSATLIASLASGAACRERSDAQIQASYDDSGKLRLLTYDSNKNGKPDTWSYMDGTRIVRVELDNNEDGVVDRWEYYSQAGTLEKVGTSQENDGRVDTWAYPAADGSTARVERSLRRDGKASRTESYKDGVLVSAEEDSDNDGIVDKWEEVRRRPAGERRVRH